MIIETGVVKKVEEDKAWVIMVKGEQCVGCPACKTFGKGSFELVAFNMIGAKPGDNVEVEINSEYAPRQSAIVFTLPVVSLIIGYFWGSFCFSPIGLSTETAGILGSLGLMLIAFVGIIGFDRIVRKSQQINAHINRIL